MIGGRFERVTELQRECLRLVLTRYSSKEIALALGISSHTVDKRLARACTTLGASNRFEAARLLAEHEGGVAPDAAYEPLVYQSPDVALPPESGMVAGSEELAPAGGGEARQAWLPLRPKGGRYNTLTVWQRLLWIVTIPAALAIAVGMLGFGLSVAGKVLRAIGAVVS